MGELLASQMFMNFTMEVKGGLSCVFPSWSLMVFSSMEEITLKIRTAQNGMGCLSGIRCLISNSIQAETGHTRRAIGIIQTPDNELD